MRYSLLLAFALLALPACVSSRLAKANETAVAALASAAVTVDETATPLANSSMDTAAEIVEASGTFAQITSLGVPSELTDANYENVGALSRIVAPDATPEQAATIERASSTSAELAGKAKSQAAFVATAGSVPIGKQVLSFVELFGSLVGVAYAATRGPKHLNRWWNEPGKTIPEDAPNSDGPA